MRINDNNHDDLDNDVDLSERIDQLDQFWMKRALAQAIAAQKADVG